MSDYCPIQSKPSRGDYPSPSIPTLGDGPTQSAPARLSVPGRAAATFRTHARPCDKPHLPKPGQCDYPIRPAPRRLPLIDYIVAHTARGECQCGRCCDKAPDRPAPAHSVDVHFFWVSAVGDPTQEEVRRLLDAHYPEMERLRGGPSYIKIGGTLGDQGLALRLIGLGELVGLWTAITPKTLRLTGNAADELAGRGFVMAGGIGTHAETVQAETKKL